MIRRLLEHTRFKHNFMLNQISLGVQLAFSVAEVCTKKKIISSDRGLMLGMVPTLGGVRMKFGIITE